MRGVMCAYTTCMQIFKLETQYIEKANPRGNALKGMTRSIEDTSMAGDPMDYWIDKASFQCGVTPCSPSGYDGLLTSQASTTNNKATIRPEDRIFSNSSLSTLN